MADPSYIVDGTLLDGEAWIALASTTLGADAANITFTDPSDGSSLDWCQFMDIVAIMYWRGAFSASTRNGLLQLNGDTTAGNYRIEAFYGDGTSVTCLPWDENGVAYGSLIANSATANAFTAAIVHFSDINSGKFKTFLVQTASDYASGGISQITSGVYKSQAPITSILFKPDAGDMLDESRIDLFGILPRMVTA